MRVLARVGGALFVVGVASSAARAQTVTYTPTFNPDRFVLTADPDSIALTESARPLARGVFAAGLALRVSGPPLSLCVRQDATHRCSEQGDLVSDRAGADLVAAIGFHRFSLHAQLPVVLHQGSDFGPEVDRDSVRAASVGDLRLGGKVGLARTDGANLGLDVTASVPTGGGDDFVGDKGTVVEGRVLVDWRAGRVTLGANAGYAWRSHSARVGNLYVDDEILWSAAVEVQTSHATEVGLAAFGRIGVIDDGDPAMPSAGWAERPAEAMLTGAYRISAALVVEMGAGVALDSGYGAPPFRALAGVRWIQRSVATPSPRLAVAAPPPPPPAPPVPPAPPPAPEIAALPPPPAELPPQPVPPPDPVVVAAPPEPEHIELHGTIDFVTARAEIRSLSFGLLDGVAATLLARGTIRVRVEGHTDARGDETRNIALSQARADAVKAYLVTKGVAADLLEAQGFGSSRPRAHGTTEADYRANRRVELVVLP